MVMYFILGGGGTWVRCFLGYVELPNKLNEREIKIKTSQKRFLACHQDFAVFTIYSDDKILSNYSQVGCHMRRNVLQIPTMASSFNAVYIHSLKVIDQNVR